MDISNYHALNENLVAHLLRIPFPFSNTLHAQIQAAKIDSESFPDLYRLYFRQEVAAPLFPQYLDMMPLSWQIPTNDAPVLIQLFIKDGFISELEVIDMGLSKIHWEYVWNTLPMLDFCYDLQTVKNLLSSGQCMIYKIMHSQNSIDLGIQSQEQKFVASFRGCQILTLPEDTVCLQAKLEFNNTTRDGSIAVTSADKKIDFTCQLLFLQWHAVGG